MTGWSAALLDALVQKAGAPCAMRGESRPWCSAGLAGEWCELALEFADEEPVRRLLAGLADYDFALPGAIVGEIAGDQRPGAVDVVGVGGGGGGGGVRIEALLFPDD